jgi:glucans biosynthesis protein
MHGGAKGSGAPRGNSNALKHGSFTKQAIELRATLRKQIREAQKLLKALRG